MVVGRAQASVLASMWVFWFWRFKGLHGNGCGLCVVQRRGSGFDGI